MAAIGMRRFLRWTERPRKVEALDAFTTPDGSLSSKKFQQFASCGVRIFFGQKMTRVDRTAGGPWCPLLPDFKRAPGFIGNADATPQCQQRAVDRLAGGAIRFVVCEVGVAAGAVVLALCVDTQGIGKGSAIVIERARIEGR